MHKTWFWWSARILIRGINYFPLLRIGRWIVIVCGRASQIETFSAPVIRNKEAPRTGNPRRLPTLRSIETAMLDHQARFGRAAPAIRPRSTRDGRLSRGERDGSSSCDAFRHRSIRSRRRTGEKTRPVSLSLSRSLPLSRSLLLKPVSRERERPPRAARPSVDQIKPVLYRSTSQPHVSLSSNFLRLPRTPKIVAFRLDDSEIFFFF